MQIRRRAFYREVRSPKPSINRSTYQTTNVPHIVNARDHESDHQVAHCDLDDLAQSHLELIPEQFPVLVNEDAFCSQKAKDRRRRTQRRRLSKNK